ncbi:hypothetical protein FB451DRAFT_1165038 [Mycena latifolia]|nr:hypothetical protein FB451DRAFT_1165038 [Mycena latifolia]
MHEAACWMCRAYGRRITITPGPCTLTWAKRRGDPAEARPSAEERFPWREMCNNRWADALYNARAMNTESQLINEQCKPNCAVDGRANIQPELHDIVNSGGHNILTSISACKRRSTRSDQAPLTLHRRGRWRGVNSACTETARAISLHTRDPLLGNTRKPLSAVPKRTPAWNRSLERMRQLGSHRRGELSAFEEWGGTHEDTKSIGDGRPMESMIEMSAQGEEMPRVPAAGHSPVLSPFFMRWARCGGIEKPRRVPEGQIRTAQMNASLSGLRSARKGVRKNPRKLFVQSESGAQVKQ